jgi:hypothetical protein
MCSLLDPNIKNYTHFHRFWNWGFLLLSLVSFPSSQQATERRALWEGNHFLWLIIYGLLHFSPLITTNIYTQQKHQYPCSIAAMFWPVRANAHRHNSKSSCLLQTMCKGWKTEIYLSLESVVKGYVQCCVKREKERRESAQEACWTYLRQGRLR